MKKLLLLSMICLFAFGMQAQYATIHKIASKTHVFKIPVKAGDLVYEVDSNAIYKVTTAYPIKTTMATIFTAGHATSISEYGLPSVVNIQKASADTVDVSVGIIDKLTIGANSMTIVPQIQSAAADTTGKTPTKIGDIYVDTSGNKVYIAKSAVRGGWLKLN